VIYYPTLQELTQKILLLCYDIANDLQNRWGHSQVIWVLADQQTYQKLYNFKIFVEPKVKAQEFSHLRVSTDMT